MLVLCVCPPLFRFQRFKAIQVNTLFPDNRLALAPKIVLHLVVIAREIKS